MDQGGSEVGDEGSKPGGDVGDVVWIGGFAEEFFDHRSKVVEGSDGW
jgi:hypothetical protein